MEYVRNERKKKSEKKEIQKSRKAEKKKILKSRILQNVGNRNKSEMGESWKSEKEGNQKK